jgi:hypothetical protein
MLTPKQNLLETLKGGHPDRLCNSFTMLKGIPGDPVFKLVRGNRIRGTNSYDQWGTYIMFPEDAPAAVPFVTEENQVIRDVTRWRDYVKVPDLAGKCADGWEEAIAAKAAIDQEQYLTMTVMGTGIFEQLHMLMTFEDTLVNLLLEPEAMAELIDVICEYRLTYMKLIVEHLHPDLICSHDDWGSKTGLFFSVETWRELFKEPYRRLYDYLHENGVIVMHHGDSFMEPLVEDMAEIGVDIWQGVLPTNDITAISEKVGDRMLLWAALTRHRRLTRSRRSARDPAGLGLRHQGFCGHDSGVRFLYPHVEPIIIDEINRYNKERFGVSE